MKQMLSIAALFLALTGRPVSAEPLNPWIGATAAVVSPVGLGLSAYMVAHDDVNEFTFLAPFMTPAFGVGQYLQGRSDRGTVFLLSEAAAGATWLVSGVFVLGAAFCEDGCSDDDGRVAGVVFAAATFALVGLRIWEVGDAVSYAANSTVVGARPEPRAGFAFSVAPKADGIALSLNGRY